MWEMAGVRLRNGWCHGKGCQPHHRKLKKYEMTISPLKKIREPVTPDLRAAAPRMAFALDSQPWKHRSHRDARCPGWTG